MTLILGIETSCDETAIGIVRGGKEILCNQLSSHIDIHQTFGGVFPELSSRRHFDLLLPLIDRSLKESNITMDEIDKVAVSYMPGLMGSLLMGINAAKALAYAYDLPLVPINHIEAHLYAAMMSEEEFVTPALGLIASGGHTALVKINSLGSYEPLATTIDDAVGEAFDKVGRLLNLSYPAGPKIEQLARGGDTSAYPFSTKRREGHFTYSGLKTQALYLLKGHNGCSTSPSLLNENDLPHFAASFQEAALVQLVDLTLKAAKDHQLSKIYVGGGVSNNRRLRAIFEEKRETGISVSWPTAGLSLDNGAMIAGLAYHKEPLSSLFSLTATSTSKKSCL